MLDHHRLIVEVLADLTADGWIEGLREARANGLLKTAYPPPPEYRPLVRYISATHGMHYGFAGHDVRLMLRLVLEACCAEDEVVYELTDLVLDGQFASDEDMIGYAEHLLNREHEIFGKTIVLTEGATDKWILERSLRLLYPHLADFYSFMDFEGMRMEGGAGALTNIVKAFAGAGISNRIIAVYDNDTAGRSAMQGLSHIKLPDNIVVMQLPPSKLAEFYPTQGPTGISMMDVNGLAASLDVYLGIDALQEGSGFAPVEWRGLDPRLRQYQGEVIGKGQIVERFRRKLTACEQDRNLLNNYDWEGMHIVLQELLKAFRTRDELKHLEMERIYHGEDDEE